jgi:hypothetical protein
VFEAISVIPPSIYDGVGQFGLFSTVRWSCIGRNGQTTTFRFIPPYFSHRMIDRQRHVVASATGVPREFYASWYEVNWIRLNPHLVQNWPGSFSLTQEPIAQ